MEQFLPPFFIALTGLCLVLVLLAARRSIASLIAERSGPARLGVGADRDLLLAEKRALLQTLRDLQFEQQTGKISEDDWKRLDATYRARAKQVLKALDAELSEYRAAAEKLIAAELGTTLGGADATAAKTTGATSTADVPEGTFEPAAVSETSSHVSHAPQGTFGAGEGADPAAAQATAVQEGIVCAACGADNDTDAVFCKKCGARIAAAEAE